MASATFCHRMFLGRSLDGLVLPIAGNAFELIADHRRTALRRFLMRLSRQLRIFWHLRHFLLQKNVHFWIYLSTIRGGACNSRFERGFSLLKCLHAIGIAQS